MPCVLDACVSGPLPNIGSDQHITESPLSGGFDFMEKRKFDFMPFDQRPWSTGFPNSPSSSNIFSPSDHYQFSSPFQQPFEKNVHDVQTPQPEVCGQISAVTEIAGNMDACDEFQSFAKHNNSFDIKVPVNESQQFCSFADDQARMSENSSRLQTELPGDPVHNVLDGGFGVSQAGLNQFVKSF